MPLDYVALDRRLTGALASANPEQGLRSIARDIQSPRGDVFDHNVAWLALSRLNQVPPDIEGAAEWLRGRFNTHRPVAAAPALPATSSAPAEDAPTVAPGSGGRRRRGARRAGKTRKSTHRRRHTRKTV